MRYVSIDIETTGLNPETCQILEIGAVIDDTDPEKMLPIKECPIFRALILHDRIEGEPFAIQMNHEIIRTISAIKFPRSDDFQDLAIEPNRLASRFGDWLQQQGFSQRVLAAGKNFASFDRRFLEKLPNWDIKFHDRTLDPMMCYLHPADIEPPKFELCLKRANLDSALQTHRAIDDAQAVCLLIRHAMKYYGSL